MNPFTIRVVAPCDAGPFDVPQGASNSAPGAPRMLFRKMCRDPGPTGPSKGIAVRA